MIYVVMGKSATGKDTIYKRIVEQQDCPVQPIVPYTTRPIRNEEQNGREYYFVSEETMHELNKKKLIIEKRTYHTIKGDWNYFTVADNNIDIIKHDYIIISTLEGYNQFVSYFGKEYIAPIYIEVPDLTRIERALSREKQQIGRSS